MVQLSNRDKHEKMLERVRSLVLSELKNTEARVYLFGSWARGTNRATSDIDIARVSAGRF